jgi:phage-related protein
VATLEDLTIRVGADTDDAQSGLSGLEKDADRSFKNVGKSAEDGLGRFSDAADNVDTKAMGFRDTMTGVQDSMLGVSEIAKGNLFEGFFLLGAGIGDLASGFANFLIPAIGRAAIAMKNFTVATARGAVALVRNTAAMIAHRVALVAGAVATAVVTAAQWAWNVAVSANPIGLIIIAIVALIAIIILLVKNWDTVVEFLKKAWEFIKQTAITVWEAIKDFFIGIWNSIKDFIADAIDKVKEIFLKFHPLGIIMRNWEPIKDFITDTWNNILGFLSGLPGKIRSRVSGMFDSFKDAFRNAINFIIRGWNGLRFTAPSVDLGPLGSFGGFTIGTPNIPLLAKGGIITAPTLAVLGEGRSDEAVIPLPPGVRDLGDLVRGSDGSEMRPEFDVFVFIGDQELTDMVDVQISKRDRRLKRRANAGAGAAR